jgi:ELWxxDGT repeat protein
MSKLYTLIAILLLSFSAIGQTILVKDIFPGVDGSFPSHLIKFGSQIYFAADDGVNGSELWKSDATTGGTTMVKDLVPGPGAGAPYNFTLFNGSLFFAAFDGVNSVLWKTDGTPGGTQIVKTFSNIGRLFNLAVVNNLLVFSIDNTANASGFELWASNGTGAGTVSIKTDFSNISVSDDFKPLRLAVLNNELFFSADDGTNGLELWKTNGTLAGTSLVQNINPSDDSSPGWLITFNNEVYFSADNGTDGIELWKTNGTNAGTSIVKDINPGDNSDPQELTASDNLFFFSANDGATGRELWSSDGTNAGTVLVKNINITISGGIEDGSNPSNLVWTGVSLLFVATTTNEGTELWKSDGTEEATILVKDIVPGSQSSNPDNLFYYNGDVYFSANDGVHGFELWKSNGFGETTELVQDINAGSDDSNPHNFAFASTLFFTATTNATGEELFILGSGTPVPVTLVKFTAQKQGSKTLLQWQTAQEKNSSGFEIQRSVNGIEFSSIGFVASGDNNNSLQSYSFIDNSPADGKNFYRLKQLDLDGKATLSPIRVIQFNDNKISIFPNPVTSVLNILTPEQSKLAIVDASGRVLYQSTVISTLSIDVSGWPSGIYFIWITGESTKHKEFKIIKQ